VLLDVSNAELIRRMAQADPAAAVALVLYVWWCAFATILNADLTRRNTSEQQLAKASAPL
jgi:translocator protein